MVRERLGTPALESGEIPGLITFEVLHIHKAARLYTARSLVANVWPLYYSTVYAGTR